MLMAQEGANLPKGWRMKIVSSKKNMSYANQVKAWLNSVFDEAEIGCIILLETDWNNPSVLNNTLCYSSFSRSERTPTTIRYRNGAYVTTSSWDGSLDLCVTAGKKYAIFWFEGDPTQLKNNSPTGAGWHIKISSPSTTITNAATAQNWLNSVIEANTYGCIILSKNDWSTPPTSGTLCWGIFKNGAVSNVVRYYNSVYVLLQNWASNYDLKINTDSKIAFIWYGA